jgi:GrpB-like predicted nucleotidyltransferase (UPF0157 family)
VAAAVPARGGADQGVAGGAGGAARARRVDLGRGWPPSRSSTSCVNLHVFSPGCPEIERYLLFRERLRGHPEERARYQRVKRELAERDWTYVQEYADAKTEVVEGIIARARGGPGA